MIFENYIKGDKKAFIDKLNSVADKLDINPNWLLGVMWKESKLDPSALNKQSGAVGLIQFIPSTAAGLGVSVVELRLMDSVRQLEYVEKYYQPYRSKLKSYPDMYLAIFMPIGLGKPDDWVMEFKGVSAEKIAAWNPAIDLNRDGKITISEFKEYCYTGIPPTEAAVLRGDDTINDVVNIDFEKKKRVRSGYR